MPSRHRSRQMALQILYQWDMRGQDLEEVLDEYFSPLAAEEGEEPPARDDFTLRLTRGTVARAAGIDQRIASRSAHWRVSRMPVVDRNLLRMAIYEMMEEGTPPAVVIDEALELAHKFSTEEAVPFINGVLDAVRLDLGGAEQAGGTPHTGA